MLHALEKNKTAYYRRYLGYRDGHEKRVCEEDEITSTVFGPLEFIEAASVFQFWSEVFRLQGRSAALPVQAPVRYKFKLWPRHEVEPDAHLTFFSAENKRFDILIEVKWHAPLSGKNQLRLQWLNYLDEDVRQNCWHVFIAPEISAGLEARDSGNVWKIGNDERLILVSWAQIRNALSKCQGRPDGLARWAALTSHFLEKIGIRRFNGFDKAQKELPVAEILHLWSFKGLTHRFTGFAVAANELPKSEIDFKLFFKE
ncbi:hypothetical protein Rfer_3050 [Rhodoferax ferrireducens T118]|uniref:Uncharacterized protein n=1 Tax=Albidiferax ferrireducens (strain ATCC BAA-621 / DSM 15236 / T118) TaxID=338969 RepID=Q21TZ3_ALBFT|nr:hypothetical protein [Rhodoferax ferrireducens]ABD70760.1 hypothetical protein Rfer_3050 [Rhodoferax ferrireducens T118]